MASESGEAPTGGDDAPAPERTGKRSRDPRLVIARRELAALKSEKTIVLALLIQLFVATFSSFLVVGLVSLYSPGSAGGYEPTFGVTGNASDVVVGAADTGRLDEGSVTFRRYVDREGAMDAFQRRDVDAVLRTNWTANGSIRVVAVAPQESLRTTLIIVKTKTILEDLEQALRERYAVEGRLERDPVEVPEDKQSSPYFAFTYTVLVPLLMLLPAFISGSIAVDSLTEEIQRGTLELLRSAPVTLPTIVDAKVLSTATLAPGQALLWLALLRFNGTAIDHWIPLVALVGAMATAVVALAVGVALLTPDRRQAQFLYSSGMLVLALVTVLLPEHPANTIAKLAIGSPTGTTWVSVGGYLALGLLAYLAVRVGVRRLDPEGL